MFKKSLLIIGLTILSVGIFAQSVNEVGAKYNEGNERYKAKEYVQAVEAYKAGLELAKQVGEDADDLKGSIETQLGNSYYKNGISLYKAKDFDGSIASLEKGYAVAKEIGDDKLLKKSVSVIAQVRTKKGDALRKDKKLDEAYAEYEMALEMKPDCAKSFYGEGMVFKEKGELEKMIEKMDLSIKYGADNSKMEKTVNAAKANSARALLVKAVEEFNAQKFDKAGEYIGLALNYTPYDEGTMEIFKQFYDQSKEVPEMADVMTKAKETLN